MRLPLSACRSEAKHGWGHCLTLDFAIGQFTGAGKTFLETICASLALISKRGVG